MIWGNCQKMFISHWENKTYMKTTITYIIESSTNRDEVDSKIYELIGISSPGAVAALCNDKYVFIWESEQKSLCDDGSKATYKAKINKAAWKYLKTMAMIDKCIEI